jgi:hypothetical protein
MAWRMILTPGLPTLANTGLDKIMSRDCVYNYGPKVVKGSCLEYVDVID